MFKQEIVFKKRPLWPEETHDTRFCDNADDMSEYVQTWKTYDMCWTYIHKSPDYRMCVKNTRHTDLYGFHVFLANICFCGKQRNHKKRVYAKKTHVDLDNEPHAFLKNSKAGKKCCARTRKKHMGCFLRHHMNCHITWNDTCFVTWYNGAWKRRQKHITRVLDNICIRLGSIRRNEKRVSCFAWRRVFWRGSRNPPKTRTMCFSLSHFVDVTGKGSQHQKTLYSRTRHSRMLTMSYFVFLLVTVADILCVCGSVVQ